MIRKHIATACLLGCLLALPAAVTSVLGQSSGTTEIMPLPAAAPAPADNPSSSPKVLLGRQLFFDPRLSGDNRMSCATCHIPEQGFADGLPKGRGAGGKELARNTPSVLNAGFYESYFWDGRAATLEEQALVPIVAAEEMNQDLDELERELSAVPAYAAQFRSVFGAGVTRDGIAMALAAYQRTLLTRNSEFDRYLDSDTSALSEEAREGWEIFQSAGCVRCHHGPNFSDSRFYRLGVSYVDRGRGVVTGESNDLYAFRTPGLRDVAKTAPYHARWVAPNLDGGRRVLLSVDGDSGARGAGAGIRAADEPKFF